MERSFSQGSQQPELVAGKIRVYSMRLCPYAQRTRMVLVLKGLAHDVVNIDLKSKPDWFLAKNPFGLVPTIEMDDGHVVYDSPICNDFLDELQPQPPLYAEDRYVRARHRMQREMFGKVITKYYENLLKEGSAAAEALAEMKTWLGRLQSQLQDDFFGGDRPMMVDIHMWPWVERFDVIKQRCEDEDPLVEFPKLRKWVERMLEQPMVQQTKFSTQMHVDFYATARTGKPNYDLGL